MARLDLETACPLSPMQQGMLFHSLYAPQTGVNVQQIVGTLRHPLNAAIFQQAWKKTMVGHPVLHTAFRWEGLKTPVQETQPEVKLPFEIENWTALSENEREKKLEAFLKGDRHRGFDLN